MSWSLYLTASNCRGLFALLIFAVTLLACGRSGQEQQEEIVYWRTLRLGGAEEAITKRITDEYMAQRPGTRVRVEYFPADHFPEKLQTAGATEKLPDLFIVDTHEPAFYAKNGLLAPVPQDIAQFVWEQAFPGNRDPIIWKGEVIGVPLDATGLVLAINADLAREAGLNPDEPPEDWAEVTEWARRMTKRDASGKLTQAGINLILGDPNPMWFGWYMAPWIGGAGAKLWTSPTTTGFTDEGFVAAVQFAKDLVNSHRVYERGVTTNDFVSGKTGMMVFGPWDYVALRLAGSTMNVRYIPAPPRNRGGQPAIMPGGWHLVVSATSRNKESAWDYVRFTLRKETRLEWCKMTSTQPTYKDIIEDPFFQSNEYHRVNASLQEKAFIPFDTGNAAIYDLYNILGAAIEKIVWEQADTRSTLAEAKREVERLMQEANR